MTKYFRNAFAEGGDRDPVPDLAAGTLVNYEKGYTPEYELDPDVDPDGNYVDRRRMNQLFNDITGNLKFWQENGVPEIVANDGTESPLSYKKGFVGSYLGTVYRALVDDTTTLPPSAEWVVYDLQDELNTKANTSTQVIAGTGLSGGGNLTANRTLSVKYGTAAGTAAQGNDSRIVNSVQTSGDQTIEGVKTFSSFPVTPSDAPTANYQAANKKYVDDSVLGVGATPFVKPVLGKPLLEKTGVTSVKIPAGLNAMVGSTPVTLNTGVTLSLDTDLVGSTAVAGTDYFVYLKNDATAYISASDVEPEGRLIAGFHYGLTGHDEAPSGNKTEADMVKLRGINAHTFWDLTFRANKWTNRGLTFDGINWIDIYLADEEYAVRGWSKSGGWIAGGAIENGRKFPIIPEMYGGNGSATYGKLTPFVAWDMLNAAGMEPISYKQFTHAMYGVEEGMAASGIETVVGKIEHYPRLTSRFGVEQATGVQYIWGADFGSSSSGTWNNTTDGRGQVYSGVQVVLLGAPRGSAVGRLGSRASRWDFGLVGSFWSAGVRGLRDHLNLDVGDDSRLDE